MCTSRLPGVLWPIERLARLSTVTFSFRAVSEVTFSIVQVASLAVHRRTCTASRARPSIVSLYDYFSQ